MLTKLKLLQDWTDTEGTAFKSGDKIEADESTATQLKELKIAIEHNEADEKLAKEIEGKQTAIAIAIAEKAVTEALANIAANNKTINIHVTADQVDRELAGYSLADNLMDIKTFQDGGSRTKHLEATVLKTVDATGLTETIDSDGGFLVGSDFMEEIGVLMHETAALVNRTRRIPIGPNSNRLQWMQVDESSRVDGSRRGGVTVARTHSNVSSTASKPTFRKQTMELEKLTGHFAFTEELAQDRVALASMVSTFFAEEFSFLFDGEIIRGTGAGEAKGILNAGAALVSVAKEDGQKANTIVKENIDNMWSRMWAPSLPRAEFFINQDCWPQLLQLNQQVGTGGAPVFIAGGNITNAPFGQLYGRPISPIEHASTLGTQGDIMFLDLGEYWTIEKGGVTAAASIHVRFLQGEELIRFTMRNNGQPNWRTALTPNQGTATQSPFVVLDARD